MHQIEYHDDCAFELRAFEENGRDPRLSASELGTLRRELRSLVAKARRGGLRFNGPRPEGTVIRSSQILYEIRLRGQSTLPGRPSRLVRLYCAEPDAVERLIVGLHLDTKPGDRADHRHEQDRAIAEAGRRADEWESERAARTS